jgi:uncharacterized membrane protein
VKSFREFFVSAVVTGLLVVVPLYLTGLLLMKAVVALREVLQPVEALLPDTMYGGYLLSLLILIVICFLVGAAFRTPRGKTFSQKFQANVLGKIPGYTLFKGLTEQLAGQGEKKTWKPALAEIEDALVPAFIIEELDDGSFTVFVPSVPTPLAGTVYILEAARVHLIDVPFSQAAMAVARWGAGSKDLVAAMRRG